MLLGLFLESQQVANLGFFTSTDPDSFSLDRKVFVLLLPTAAVITLLPPPAVLERLADFGFDFCTPTAARELEVFWL